MKLTDTKLSIIRHLLGLVGGFLLARGVTDAVTAEAITGGIMAALAFFWGTGDELLAEQKNKLRAAILSGVRHLLGIIGGVLVNKGVLDATASQDIIGGVLALTALIWGPYDEHRAANPKLPEASEIGGTQ